MHVDSISDLLHNLSEISVFPVTCKGQTRIRFVPYIDECCSNRSTVWTMDSCRTLWVSEFWWGVAARKMQIATVTSILRFLSEVRCEFLSRLPVSFDNFPRIVAQHLERDIQVFGCHSRSRIVRCSGYDKSHPTIYRAGSSAWTIITSKSEISCSQRKRKFPVVSGSDKVVPYRFFASRYAIEECGLPESYGSSWGLLVTAWLWEMVAVQRLMSSSIMRCASPSVIKATLFLLVSFFVLSIQQQEVHSFLTIRVLADI